MSQFKVEVRKIDSVSEHPNADRLELYRAEGLDFQFVHGKGALATGDLVVYFPVDSLLPPPLIRKMGLEGKLSGKEKNRVKTVKLRGEISQGVVVPLADLLGDFIPPGTVLMSGQDLTETLGVTKYEPPEIPCHAGKLVRLPPTISAYDIEGCDRFTAVAESLLDAPVSITEKIEGTNFSITLDLTESRVCVNQHRYSIIEAPEEGENSFWKTAREQGLIAMIENLAAHLSVSKSVTAFGELIGPGIQGNIYGLKSFMVLFYDIKADQAWIPAASKFEAFARAGLDNKHVVPILCMGKSLREWLGNKTIKEASNAKSLLYDGPREGIVISPMVESEHPAIGRLILKQRSPEYLAKSDT